MAARSKPGLGRLVTGIVGSNSAQGMEVCLCVYVLCCPAWLEAFALGLSIVQRNRTACLNTIKQPHTEGQGSIWGVAP
jgi:hypothetical protein